ncbi:MAG TPA: branched-chain amino acid ABC transporter ATP-binding protein/permease [Candidatus Dormibacteraeota bacterium]|nr:branched-chain amino acid ABC transporter ATP-binding protein/permease [Candidatus Dormibacteraeota bacterium]
MLAPLALAAFLLVLPPLADGGLALPTLGTGPSLVHEVEIIALYSMVVVGLNLTYGYAGELALGQAAIFAGGAYATGILAMATIYHHPVLDLAITLPVSALVAALVGFISGAPGLRVAGWALAYISFFLVLLIPDMASAFPAATGGLIGLTPIPNPSFLGIQLDSNGVYWAMIGCAIVVFAVFRNLIRSRHGEALQVLRQSPIMASSLGISVYRLKLMAYVIGAIPAGIAGGLYCYLNNFLSPGLFDIYTAIGFIAASVLGGSRTIYGGIVGVVILQEIGPLHTSSFTQYALPVYGALLVTFGVVLTGGLTGSLGTAIDLFRRRFLRDKQPSLEPQEFSGDVGHFEGAELVVTGVSKSFGGNQALSDVSLTATPGKVTAIIGPNGSGKTSLLNIVSGFYRPDKGTVRLGDQDLTLKAPSKVALAGVARTFQTPSIPAGLTCLQVVSSARYARDTSGLMAAILRLPSYRRKVRRDIEEGERLLGVVGLSHLAKAQATTLPLGTRRLLEVARALVARPAAILLDEPASGLSMDEVRRLSRLICQIAAAGATVVVIEHNFQMMLEVADVINVLREGRLIATGSPTEIRSNPVVIESYLGEETEEDT